MTVRNEQAGPDGVEAARASRQMLFRMAVFSTVLGVLYLAGLLGKLIVDGSINSTSSAGVQSISAVIALLWDVALLILFAALRREASGSRAFYAELALLFMALVCATSSVNWFIQLTIVPSLAGRAGLMGALLDSHNEFSITFAMEHLGWGLFYGLAALFAAAATGKGGLENWIRWLFITGGALSLLHLVGVAISNPTLGLLGYFAWGLLLPVTTALLAVECGRSRGAGSPLRSDGQPEK